MNDYRLFYVVKEPSEETGWMYMAEVPELQGCCAWADTQEDAVEILRSVATEYISLCQENGDELPDSIKPETNGLMVVAV